MSQQLAWFLLGTGWVVLLHSAGMNWKEERGSALSQIVLALTILVMSIVRIVETW